MSEMGFFDLLAFVTFSINAFSYVMRDIKWLRIITIVAMVGDLSVFGEARRPPDLPAYQHDDLDATFRPVMNELRRALSMVLEQNAIQIELHDRNPQVASLLAFQGGIRVASYTASKHGVAGITLDWHLDAKAAQAPTQRLIQKNVFREAGALFSIEMTAGPDLLTAGDEKPVKLALKRLLAMRAYKRAQNVEGTENLEVLKDVGLSKAQAEDMYRYLAIANYEDRYVIPTAHREEAMSEAFAERNGCGFSFGSGCNGSSEVNMFGGKKANRRDVLKTVQLWED